MDRYSTKEEELLEEYSCEELLTSGNAYLRKLGMSFSLRVFTSDYGC